VAYRQFRNDPDQSLKDGRGCVPVETALAPVKQGSRKPFRPRRLRVQMQVPHDLPIAQIEIEVLAALLDDWVGNGKDS